MYELVVLAVQLCRQCACFRLFEGTVTDKAEVDLRVQVVSCRARGVWCLVHGICFTEKLFPRS